jgi:hypothetical protein
MESEQWFKDRKAGENLLRALGKTTPASLKTLQDMELARIIGLLAEVIALCGQERRERPIKSSLRSGRAGKRQR